MARVRKDNDQRYLLKADGPFVKLDSNGQLPPSVLPPLAITETFVVANEAERLALNAQKGDIAIQIDNGITYILYGTDPSVAVAWVELSSPESDPVFVASPAFNITGTQISNWDTAHSWGNHASAGYLTSFTETDPTVPSHVKTISTTNISNWNTAYGWGNHAGAGYATFQAGGYSGTYNIPINTGGNSFLYPNPNAGGVTITGSSGQITTPNHGNSSQWNTAYGWGNHALAGYGTSSFSGSYNDLSNKPTIPTNTNQLTNGAGYITSSGSITGNAATATTAASCSGNSATATWADTVDVNSGQTSQNSWYPVTWHSGDTIYSSPGVVIYPNGGYLQAGYLNMTHSTTTRNSDTIFFSSTDDYIRKNNASGFRSSLNVPTRTGGNASGTWGINVTGSSGSCTGNAATATTATNVTGISRNVGNYGSISANTTRNGYYGLSCNGHLVLMSNGSAHGIYDDVQNEWWVRFYENAGVHLHHNGSKKIETTSAGVSVTGSMTASGEVTAFSDARLKSDVKTLDGDKVYEMRGVSYTKDGAPSSGVIAQELQQVAPELVHEGEEYLSVAYGNLVGYLIEAVKDLKAEVEELKRGNTDKQTSESVDGSD